MIEQKFRKSIFKINNCNRYVNNEVFFLQSDFRRCCEKGLKKEKKEAKKVYRCY